MTDDDDEDILVDLAKTFIALLCFVVFISFLAGLVWGFVA